MSERQSTQQRTSTSQELNLRRVSGAIVRRDVRRKSYVTSLWSGRVSRDAQYTVKTLQNLPDVIEMSYNKFEVGL